MKKNGAIASYIGTGICVIMGLYKMFVYENAEYSWETSKNSYVGGDAYNYIINAGYSTAWFVLAGVFAIIGLTFVVAYYFDKNSLAETEKEIIESATNNE